MSKKKKIMLLIIMLLCIGAGAAIFMKMWFDPESFQIIQNKASEVPSSKKLIEYNAHPM